MSNHGWGLADVAQVAAVLVGVLFASMISTVSSDIAFVLLTVCILAVSALIVYSLIRGTRLGWRSIPSLWYASYAGLIVLPALYLFLQQPSRPERETFLMGVLVAAVCVPVGMVVANILLRFRRAELYAFFNQRLEVCSSRGGRGALFGLVFLVTCVIAVNYFYETSRLGVQPLVLLLQEGSSKSELARLREDAFKLLDSPIKPFYTITRDLGFPLLVMVGIGYYQATKRKAWLWVALASFVIGLGYGIGSLARSPAVLLVGIIVMYLYLGPFGLRRLSRLRLALGAAGAGGLLVMLTRLVSPGLAWTDAITTAWERIFLAPANILWYYFEAFPSLGLLYGRSAGRILDVFGVESFDVSNYVSLFVNPSNTIKSGSANAAFVGSIYMDLGFMGVVFGSLLTGLVIQGAQVLFVRSRKTVFTTAVYTFTCYQVILLTILPLTSVFLYSGLPMLLLLVFCGRYSYRV